MNLSFTLSIIINLKLIAPKLLKNIETSKKTFQHPNLYITNCNYFQTKTLPCPRGGQNSAQHLITCFHALLWARGKRIGANSVEKHPTSVSAIIGHHFYPLATHCKRVEKNLVAVNHFH